jgi:hypothetical protein
MLATLAGGSDDDDDDATLVDGEGPAARFSCPVGMTVDAAGHIVVADCANHALARDKYGSILVAA